MYAWDLIFGSNALVASLMLNISHWRAEEGGSHKADEPEPSTQNEPAKEQERQLSKKVGIAKASHEGIQRAQDKIILAVKLEKISHHLGIKSTNFAA